MTNDDEVVKHAKHPLGEENASFRSSKPKSTNQLGQILDAIPSKNRECECDRRQTIKGIGPVSKSHHYDNLAFEGQEAHHPSVHRFM